MYIKKLGFVILSNYNTIAHFIYMFHQNSKNKTDLFLLCNMSKLCLIVTKLINLAQIDLKYLEKPFLYYTLDCFIDKEVQK